MERDYSPLVTHGKYAADETTMFRLRAQSMFRQRLCGNSMQKVAESHQCSQEKVRAIVAKHASRLYETYEKWKRAEIRCHAMAMEIALLRLGKEVAPDRPLEAINTPPLWLRHFKQVGIETVNQLRAVDPDMLLAHWRFPKGAIEWAILELGKRKLSHRLRHTTEYKPPKKLGKRFPKWSEVPHLVKRKKVVVA